MAVNCLARTDGCRLGELFEVSDAKPHVHHGPKGGKAPPEPPPFAAWAPKAYASRANAPLSLYLHVPFCRHRCTFCPFFQNVSKAGFSASYAALLQQDITMTADALGESLRTRQAEAVYFGGGTPSDMDATDLAKVIERLKAAFPLADDAEVTVEGRVRGFTREKAEAWVEAGANRFSLGIQSTNSQLRRRLGRLADREEVRQTLNELKATGALVIVDLIFGLPGQDAASVLEDIRFLSDETGIDGLDLYELKPFPGSPMMKAVKDGRLSAPADRADRGDTFEAACEALAALGFEHFTPQHFRRNTQERSRYNRLAKIDADMLPFGSSAGGRLGSVAMMGDRDLGSYTTRLQNGELPVRVMGNPFVVKTAPTFADNLAAALESRSLPPLAIWPETSKAMTANILTNWQNAGLIEAIPNDEGNPIPLTQTGCYWSQHLQRLLLGMAKPSEHKAA